jgi:DNA-binding Lrp family transcriptional regulator
MNRDGRSLRDVELRLISELLKDSRRSDREIAKAMGVSQPTVTRTLAKLRKEGSIRSQTIIPDFAKIGFSLLGITFVKLKSAYSSKEIDNVRKAVNERVEQSQFNIVMLERGMGLGYDGCIISIYKDYSEYSRHQSAIKGFPFIDNSKVETFIINLQDDIRYHPLSFEAVAKHLATPENTSKKP